MRYLIALGRPSGARWARGATSEKSEPASSRATMRAMEVGVAGRVIFLATLQIESFWSPRRARPAHPAKKNAPDNPERSDSGEGALHRFLGRVQPLHV